MGSADENRGIETGSSPAWVLWVAGWSLLVGALVIVLPCYFFLGTQGALWASGAVAVVSAVLVWLSAEAHAAFVADRLRQEASYDGAERATLR
ncbi:MAG TPA: hypothetical protein VLC09_19545 [Polyangiaceae bacterium]|nr:hypothetical protein [Polyangiaceae bacterium]